MDFIAAKNLRGDERPRGSQLGNFILIHESGEYNKCFNEACYSNLGMSEGEAPFKDPIEYFIDYPKRGFIGGRLRAHEETYLTWLVNDSTFADAFITKDIEEIMDEGMFMNVHFPPQYVVSAAIAVRYLYEYKSIVSVWDKLKGIINPMAAFYLAHYVILYGKGEYVLKEHNHGYDGHHAFGRPFSSEGLRALINCDEKNWKACTQYNFNQDSSYYNLTDIWGESKYGRKDPVKMPVKGSEDVPVKRIMSTLGIELPIPASLDGDLVDFANNFMKENEL
tara:strand:- start:16683 stop:17519 length:837 start_codon:yes stop_codon:yes gene_type:complete